MGIFQTFAMGICLDEQRTQNLGQVTYKKKQHERTKTKKWILLDLAAAVKKCCEH